MSWTHRLLDSDSWVGLVVISLSKLHSHPFWRILVSSGSLALFSQTWVCSSWSYPPNRLTEQRTVKLFLQKYCRFWCTWDVKAILQLSTFESDITPFFGCSDYRYHSFTCYHWLRYSLHFMNHFFCNGCWVFVLWVHDLSLHSG